MKKLLVYILLICSAVFWGISFIITKELFSVEPNITVSQLVALRLLLATIVTVPLLLLTHRMEPIRRGDLKWFLLLSLAEPFLYHICETSGVQLLSGSLSSVVVATIPLFVPFGMALAYRERLHATTLIGVALSLIGIGIMLFNPNEGLTSENPIGLLYLAGAVVIAVVYTLFLVRVVKHYRPITITAYQNIFGLLYFLPLLVAVDRGAIFSLTFSPKMLLLILTLGLLCSTLAYCFYNYGVRHLGASAACIFNNTIPIFSLIAAIIIGQECFAWNKAFGIVIVISGVVIAQRHLSSQS